MARPIWRGSLTFGLVTVPVVLYSATEDHSIRFHQFERGTSDRIRNRRVNERSGKEVEYQDIVKGYEDEDGELVQVETEELDNLAPGRSREIAVDAFVDLAEIDPIFFQKTYWLAPAKPDYAHPYDLMARAMAETNRAAIALFVMRGRQYLTAVRARDGMLVLETMYFADEIRDPRRDISELAESGEPPRRRELDMATHLIESMSGPWQPEEYHDTYTERVAELVANKRSGKPAPKKGEEAEPTNVVDLVDVLRRSVERAGERRRRGGGGEPDLSELAKADLERMARELGIRGRSKMTRAELEKAVRGASRKKAS